MMRVANVKSYWCHFALRKSEGRKVSIFIEVSLTCSLPTCPLTSENRKVVRGQRGEQDGNMPSTAALTGQHSLETLWSANSSRGRVHQPGHRGTSRKYSPSLFSVSCCRPWFTWPASLFLIHNVCDGGGRLDTREKYELNVRGIFSFLRIMCPYDI